VVTRLEAGKSGVMNDAAGKGRLGSLAGALGLAILVSSVESVNLLQGG
jgi:hypothetical protein